MLGHGKSICLLNEHKLTTPIRFNKIGNREMYMNCAPVEIVPKDNDKRDDLSEHIEMRDVQKTNAAAQASLSSYPPLFVANLKSVNDCVTKETQDVVFDTPGKSVDFADGINRSGKPSFGTSQCTGKGGKNAGSSSPSSPQGQWQPTAPSSPGSSSNCNDGQYHEECHGGPSSQKAISGSAASASAKPAQQAQAQQSNNQQQVQDVKTGDKPSPKVEQELDAYLKKLYGGSRPSKRDACSSTKPPTGGCSSPGRWVRKGECTWSCERQGKTTSTSTKSAAPTKTASSASKESAEVASNLKTLGADISAMVQLVLAKQSATSAGAKDIDANLARLNTDIARLVKACVKGATTSKQTEANLKSFQTSLKTLVQGMTLRKPSRLVKREDTFTSTPSSSLDAFLAYLARLQTTVIECIRNLTTTDSLGSPLLNSTVLVNSTLAAIDAAAAIQSTLKPARKRQSTGWFAAADLPTEDLESDTVFTGMRRLGLDFERLYDSLRPEGDGADTSDLQFLTIPLWMAKDDSRTHAPRKRKRQNAGWFDAADLPADELADDAVFTGMRDLGLDYERLYDALRPQGDAGDVSDMQFLTVPLGMAKDEALSAKQLSAKAAASNPLQDAADRAAFEAALARDEVQNEPLRTNSTSKPEVVEALLPLVLGPGPAAPPGLEGVWPATNGGEHVGNLEDMPVVVDDLGPGAEEEVKEFFANLAKDAGASDADGEKDRSAVTRRWEA